MKTMKRFLLWTLLIGGMGLALMPEMALARPHGGPGGWGGPGPGRGWGGGHYPGWRRDVVFDSIGLGIGVGALALGAVALANQPDVVVAPAPVYAAPAPVVIQQPVVVQQPVYQQPVYQQPVVQEVQPAGHWVERDERTWVEGAWVPNTDSTGRRTQTWQPGYWKTSHVREWVNN